MSPPTTTPQSERSRPAGSAMPFVRSAQAAARRHRCSAPGRCGAIVLAVALCAAFAALVPPAGAAPAARPTCFGMEATIVADRGAVTMGTRGPDVIVGTNGDDVIVGGGGRDLICGRGGDDRIRGGGGADRIRAGGGADRVRGGADRDIIAGNGGDDDLRGNAGDDRLVGGRGKDQVTGGRGNDVLRGGGGADTLDGSAGRDRCGRITAKDVARRCIDLVDIDPAPLSIPIEDPAVAELRANIEALVMEPYGADFPWLVTAWRHIGIDGELVVDVPGVGIAGQVKTECASTNGELPACVATTMTIHPDFVADLDTLVHELAHVYERTHGLAPDARSVGRAQLWMASEYGTDCDPAEVFADTLLSLTIAGASLSYFDFACPALPDGPTPEAVAVVQSVLDGAPHPWFDSVHANGAQAWAAIAALADTPSLDFERYEIITNLAEEFGGYCSDSHTLVTAFFGGTDPNPWADDGCATG